MSSTSTTSTVLGSAPASMASSHARCFDSASAWSRGVSVSENTLAIWPDTCAMAEPTAFATPKFSGRSTLSEPSKRSGARMEPPPTRITVTSPAEVFIASTASSMMRVISA